LGVPGLGGGYAGTYPSGYAGNPVDGLGLPSVGGPVSPGRGPDGLMRSSPVGPGRGLPNGGIGVLPVVGGGGSPGSRGARARSYRSDPSQVIHGARGGAGVTKRTGSGTPTGPRRQSAPVGPVAVAAAAAASTSPTCGSPSSSSCLRG